ncbi:cation diffusion facilitator family transporter [Heyndrickxia acidiproducens]|uniref:cation diffusion facilitator family transporter n=1 Tax=Heyndrickxia acidiproducens TaxID=1121084 RepID=UPI00037F6DA3|nr:cation diffusion facilitator family transporter [Heyndrickxia acidiproducens]
MKEMFRLLKGGNKPSLLAAIVNAFIGLLKGVSFFFTGNVAMFAEMMHSLGDAANQLFVFIGSALSKKAPTPKFPNGFGRVVNLVCLGAVIIVAILSYETIVEGFHQVMHPVESSGMVLNIIVLAVAVLLELSVWHKAAEEILAEAQVEAKGLQFFSKSFVHLNKARPATKLVFMEDTVATLGGILAILSIIISHFTGLRQAEGIASIIIGVMMFYVVGKIFLENARGAIGETDEEMRMHIANLILADPDIKDIQRLTVLKEGEHLHVKAEVEISPAIAFSQADDIKDRLYTLIMAQNHVTDVLIEFDRYDDIQHWQTNQPDPVR